MSVRTKTMMVAVACDCDPDRPDFGGSRYDRRHELVWRGVAEGIPALVEALEDWADNEGIPRPPITWCVRSDLQMAEIYGDCAWPYRRFEKLWRELEASGDEIAWHPHLWRWSDAQGCWYQETEDDEWMVECLERGYEALCKAYGGRIITCRMGWEFHNNVTMQMIDELGIQVDMSAVPGRHREAKSDRGSIKHGELDWEITGHDPYRPSCEDYRRAPINGEAALEVIEIPRAATTSRLWGIVRKAWRATSALRRGDMHSLLSQSDGCGYVHAPALTSRPAPYRQLLRSWLSGTCQRGNRSAFVTSCHADELMPNASGVYGAQYALRNTKQILSATASRDSHALWAVTARSLLDRLTRARANETLPVTEQCLCAPLPGDEGCTN